jgi:hypothetical protein
MMFQCWTGSNGGVLRRMGMKRGLQRSGFLEDGVSKKANQSDLNTKEKGHISIFPVHLPLLPVFPFLLPGYDTESSFLPSRSQEILSKPVKKIPLDTLAKWDGGKAQYY